MRSSPSIIPDAVDRDVYLVLDDFGRLGRSWREMDEEDTDRTTVVRALLDEQYNAPVQDHQLSLIYGPPNRPNAQYLRVYVHQLRQKVEADPERPEYILTETGIGYRLRPQD
jgi:DNA-binding response OmpR family regulator